jgi:hypothetical protein
MLTQLARLSLEVDGRYATDQELQFLEDYLQTVDQRLSAYEKIRNAEEKITHKVKQLAYLSAGFETNLVTEQELQPLDSFHNQSIEKRVDNYEKIRQVIVSKDMTQMCVRDLTLTLRFSATAMLIDDLDGLRNALLIWYQTIVRCFGFQKFTVVVYKILQEVVSEHLTPEEAELIMPALQLDHSILSL